MTVREMFGKTWWIACLIVVFGFFVKLPVIDLVALLATIYIWIDIILMVGCRGFNNPLMIKIDNFQLWK